MDQQDRKRLGPLKLILIYGFVVSGLANMLVSKVLQPWLQLTWGWEAFLAAAISGSLALLLHGILKKLGYLQ